ncbi:hypothetical protein [Sphingomonas sp. PWP1-2]|uniref:hypothetical protein n=1 Tax=Sphingomonas sp. PWP1-2 TaxID=2804558 RepID=UPI003CF9BCCE
MSISTRIRKLEDELGPDGRLIVCSRPADMTDPELEGYLHSFGISTTAQDLIISIERFGDRHPDPWVMIDGRAVAAPRD